MRYVIYVLSFVLLLSSTAKAEALRPKLDDLVRHYAKVVFGSEFNPNHIKKALTKWEGEVGVAVMGQAPKQLTDMASKHLSTIAKLTKVKFKVVEPGTLVNRIDLIFMKRKYMTNINGLPPVMMAEIKLMAQDPTMRCFFLSQNDAQHRIIHALIMVNTDMDPAQINACMLEEFSQVMGLPNDVDAYWPTIFQPFDTSTELSVWDQLYLKTLYDPRMKAGMKPVDALFTAKQIFAEAMEKIP